MFKRKQNQIGRCLNCNQIINIGKLFGKEKCPSCGHLNPIKKSLNHKSPYQQDSTAVEYTLKKQQQFSVQQNHNTVTCVCGEQVDSDYSFCPRCGMVIRGASFPTIEITGVNHKEVIEVANNCYEKIIEPLQHLSSDPLNTNPLSEEMLCRNIQKTLLNIQKNPIFRGCKEDVINDAIRDNLCMIYDIYDQTRQGESETGKEAGEVDLLIKDKQGLPYALIEALRLSALNKESLNSHISKVLSKYDPIGCPYVFVFTYATGKSFDSFWKKYYQYLCEYTFPYKAFNPVLECENPYAESRHAYITLQRNGVELNVHFYVIHLPS